MIKEKVLITGGAGFIGSNASNILSEEGYEVIAFDNLYLGKKNNLDKQVRFVNGDVKNSSDLASIGKVDYIIHLAASSSAPMFAKDLTGTFSNNIIGHIKVLEYAKSIEAKKILFASTSSIYGNNPVPLVENQLVIPPNYYSVTKHCQEELSRVYSELNNIEIIAFRFMSVYGLHEEHKGRFANLVSQFIWGMEQGRKPTIYGDGSQTRDFTNVKDLVRVFKSAIETDKKFGFTIFNIGTADAINMIDLMKVINKVMGTKINGEFINNPITTGYIKNQEADLTKIEDALNYKPTVPIEEGIREIVEYRKKYPIKPVSMSY